MNYTIIFLFVIAGISSCKAQSTTTAKNESISQIENTTKAKTNKFPEASGFVSDFEGVFTQEQAQKLERKLDEYQLRTGRIIVVVTVENIAPYNDIKNFAVDLSNEWGIGDRDKNDGLSIVLSTTLREVRISTGLGTEKILTDEICQNIINTIMLPEFKNGNYYEGINRGLNALADQWK
ncbi:TPM domain-containing protein [Nonlabens marinus]|uniref:TPM domain-containing protein n=1 Tax=Nonlabens marinus S1-08 TaxID=1454201 RepID=W8VNT8_9FLAO|nr:TPM domain-containing protein [Nonlabens marinus]BAO54649.1 hypothetical protein NMS_0640 [Nonlabens marinus S1-08]